MLANPEAGFPFDIEDHRYRNTGAFHDLAIRVYESVSEAPGEGPAYSSLAGAHHANKKNTAKLGHANEDRPAALGRRRVG
jgi:hypothetical protein